MKALYAYVYFFSFLATLYATGSAKSDCLEKEKTIALLDLAKDSLSKAKDTYPSCEENSNSTDESECSEKTSLAYIEISKKLISEISENFPTCIGPNITVQYVKYRDCSEIFSSGQRGSGVYTIWPRESNTTGKPIQVYCDMENDDGGWTVIQRRGKFQVQQDFYQGWENYKNGFGNVIEEFWLGNENIRVLCHKGCKIRFDLQTENGERRFAVYQNFILSGSRYTLQISNYTGNAGDSMRYHNKFDFSTKDKGDSLRVERFHAGWWYNSNDENHCNLNALYQPGKNYYPNVFWYTWENHKSLATVEMKVMPN